MTWKHETGQRCAECSTPDKYERHNAKFVNTTIVYLVEHPHLKGTRLS